MSKQYCKCGCGKIVKTGRAFTKGHHTRSPDYQEKMRQRRAANKAPIANWQQEVDKLYNIFQEEESEGLTARPRNKFITQDFYHSANLYEDNLIKQIDFNNSLFNEVTVTNKQTT